MKNSKGTKAIVKVARNRGVSVAEVRRETEFAIDAAMSDPDPAARTLWDQYIQSGRKPTPEEFIVYLAQKVKSHI